MGGRLIARIKDPDLRKRALTRLQKERAKSDAFDKAVAAFSVAYADQNEQDHDALERAVKKGRVKAVFEAER